ncbi:MAG TPA: protein kinase [Sumerlaeia bacterium]|nr:protein kinase [Sumerlaeia bacterium]
MASDTGGLLALVRSRFAGARAPWVRPRRLGESLLRAGLIDREQLDTALDHQLRKGQRIGYHLVKLGYVEESALGAFLAEGFRVPAIDEASIHLRPELFEGIPAEVLSEGDVFPLARAGRTLTLVMADPTDRELIDDLSRRLDVAINPVVAPQSVIKKYVARHLALEKIRQNLGRGDEAQEVTYFLTHLKDYRFQKVLGVGGFGMVSKCWQISLDRPVAIKTMKRQISQIEGMVDRFKREGKIIARLNHPNIIQVYEQGESRGILYIVMEYFEGRPLDVDGDKKDLVEKIGRLIPVCDALHYAFQRGVVHRDIKPANILVNDLGEVKLLDFGVAYHANPDETRFTRQNVVLGTPKYMAPECFEGTASVTTLADVYAMGVVAYELLTGDEFAMGKTRPPAELDPAIPDLLSKTILKALEMDRSKRLQSFDLMKRALIHSRDQLLMGHTIAAGRIPAADKGAEGPALAAASPKPETPAKCYEEVSVLREDDEARVVVAQHSRMQRKVVVKHVPSRYVDQEKLTRLTDIKHPNIGEVLGTGRDGDRRVLVLEYLDAGSLADRMQGGAVPAENCAVWFYEMVLALQTARDRGVAHGRLHPGNILFSSNGKLKLVDFWSTAPRTAQFARYSRPEITDPWQCDRYALGVMWFEMLTGERFRGAQSYEKNFKRTQEDTKIEPLLRVALGRLWGIQRYGRRYENISEMVADLRIIREKVIPPSTTAERVRQEKRGETAGKSSRGRRALVVAVVLLVALGSALVAHFLSRGWFP